MERILTGQPRKCVTHAADLTPMEWRFARYMAGLDIQEAAMQLGILPEYLIMLEIAQITVRQFPGLTDRMTEVYGLGWH